MSLDDNPAGQLGLFDPPFECVIDESAGQEEEHRKTQIVELPGETFEDIFA